MIRSGLRNENVILIDKISRSFPIRDVAVVIGSQQWQTLTILGLFQATLSYFIYL